MLSNVSSCLNLSTAATTTAASASANVAGKWAVARLTNTVCAALGICRRAFVCAVMLIEAVHGAAIAAYERRDVSANSKVLTQFSTSARLHSCLGQSLSLRQLLSDEAPGRKRLLVAATDAEIVEVFGVHASSG